MECGASFRSLSVYGKRATRRMKSLWSCPSRSLICLYSNCQVWSSSYIGLYKNEIISNNSIQKIGLEKEDEELTLLNSQQYIFFLKETEYSWPSKSMVPHPQFQPTTVVFEVVAILSLAIQFMWTIESQPQWHRLTAWVWLAGIFFSRYEASWQFCIIRFPQYLQCSSVFITSWGRVKTLRWGD